jgi:hypothetical protein
MSSMDCRVEEALSIELIQNPPPKAKLDHMERGWLPGEFHHRTATRGPQNWHDPLVKVGSVRVAEDGHFVGRFVADCVSCEVLLIGRVAPRSAVE